MMTSQLQRPAQEAAFSWIAALACSWSNFCILGVQRSSTVIFVALVENFAITREDAAWPSGVFGIFMCLSGILSGYFNQYFSNRSIMMVGACVAALSVSFCSLASNIRHIVFFYGALQGAGIGIIIPMTNVTLNQYFRRHRALALGIAYAGSSIGSFIFPALAHWMLHEFSLSGTFLLLGGLMLHSLVGISLLKHPSFHQTSVNRQINSSVTNTVEKAVVIRTMVKKAHSGNSDKAMDIFAENSQSESINPFHQSNYQKTGRKHLLYEKLKTSLYLTRDILTNPTFLLISVIFAIYFSVSQIFIMVALDFALDKQMTKVQGLYFFLAFSIGDFAGRLGCGWLGDLNSVSRKFVVCCYLLTMSSVLTLLPYCSTFYALNVMSVTLGVLSGGIIVNHSPVLTEYMGLEKLSLVIGFSSCIVGIMAFLRPVIIGYFRDQYQSYKAMFVFLGVVQIVVTMIWLIEDIWCRLKAFLKNFS